MDAEEDKELMMIRLETLKTMVGKLEKKKKLTVQRESCQHTQKQSIQDTLTADPTFKKLRTTRTVASSSTSSIFQPSNQPSYSKHKYVNPSILNNKAVFTHVSSLQTSSNPIHKPVSVLSKHKFVRTANAKPPQVPPSVTLANSKSQFTYRRTDNTISTVNIQKPSLPKSTYTKLVPAGIPKQTFPSSRTFTQVPSIAKTISNKFSAVNRYHVNNTLKIDNTQNLQSMKPSGKVTSYPFKKLETPVISRYKYRLTQDQSKTKAYGYGIKPPMVSSAVKTRFRIANQQAYQTPTKRIFIKQYITHYKSRYHSFSTRRANYLKNLSAFKYVSSVLPSKPQLSTSQSHVVRNQKVQSQPSKVNANKLVLSRHGSNYLVSSNMKSLKRLNSSGAANKSLTSSSQPKRFKYQRSNSLNKKISTKQFIASRVLKKSRILTAVQRTKKKKTRYCLFFNRYGQCKRGEKCDFIHDPQKVAVCTRFLRGTCKDEKCLFSHKLDPSKMPVCSYFLMGQCTKDDCPYRHVNVNESADVCQDFVKGYCPQGDKCTKKHILECTEFSKTGKCSRGTACKLYHRAKRTISKRSRRRQSSLSGVRKPRGFSGRKSLDKREVEESELSSPLKNKDKAYLLPKFISENLNDKSHDATRVLSFSSVRHSAPPSASSSTPASDVEMPFEVDESPDAGPSVYTSDNDFDFIPIGVSSSEDESDLVEEGETTTSRRFSMTEKDFISLE